MWIGLGLSLSGKNGPSAAAIVESTWNGTDAVTADWTRTNAGKTLQRTGVVHAFWRHVRGTTGHAAGKYYFEIVPDNTVAASANWMSGLSNATASTVTYMGASAYGLGIRAAGSLRNGFTAVSGAVWASAATVAGDTMMFAVDATAGKVWLGLNGSWLSSGDPVAGTGEAYTYVPATVGAVFPAIGVANTLGLSRFTLKTGAFNYSVPSGFSAWG